MGLIYCPDCFAHYDYTRDNRCPDCRERNARMLSREKEGGFEKQVIDAIIRRDPDWINYMIKTGSCSRDYVERIKHKVSCGYRGKNVLAPAWGENPCSEVSLGKTEESSFQHPTARVKQNYYLLIG